MVPAGPGRCVPRCGLSSSRVLAARRYCARCRLRRTLLRSIQPHCPSSGLALPRERPRGGHRALGEERAALVGERVEVQGACRCCAPRGSLGGRATVAAPAARAGGVQLRVDAVADHAVRRRCLGTGALAAPGAGRARTPPPADRAPPAESARRAAVRCWQPVPARLPRPAARARTAATPAGAGSSPPNRFEIASTSPVDGNAARLSKSGDTGKTPCQKSRRRGCERQDVSMQLCPDGAGLSALHPASAPSSSTPRHHVHPDRRHLSRHRRRHHRLAAPGRPCGRPTSPAARKSRHRPARRLARPAGARPGPAGAGRQRSAAPPAPARLRRAGAGDHRARRTE